MFIVPIAGDKIVSKDGKSYVVTDFNALNTNDDGKAVPAVYAQNSGETVAEPFIIPFDQIRSVNGVDVISYKQNIGLLEVTQFKRKLHLPQIGDKIVVYDSTQSDLSDNTPFTVKKIRLIAVSKHHSLRVVFEVEENTKKFTLKDILSCEPNPFPDRSKYLKTLKKVYGSYFPFIKD